MPLFTSKFDRKRVALNANRVETSRHLSNVSSTVIKVVPRGDAGSLSAPIALSTFHGNCLIDER